MMFSMLETWISLYFSPHTSSVIVPEPRTYISGCRSSHNLVCPGATTDPLQYPPCSA